jgi:hypothetical protein
MVNAKCSRCASSAGSMNTPHSQRCQLKPLPNFNAQSQRVFVVDVRYNSALYALNKDVTSVTRVNKEADSN